MVNRLFVGDAWGWETESRSQVAIHQLRTAGTIQNDKCAKAQLIKNDRLRSLGNTCKVLGYIPVINVVAGIFAINEGYSQVSKELGPNHSKDWKIRGVTIILAGPLLIIVDLIIFIVDQVMMRKVLKENPTLPDQFNVNHEHQEMGFWPGVPVECLVQGRRPQVIDNDEGNGS